MRLKGLHWVYRARKDGSRTYYYYAFKNGPLIHKGDQLPVDLPPDHPIFAAFQKAHEESRVKPSAGHVNGLVAAFRASTDYTGMADSTRAQWRRWLGRIEDEFGEFELEAIDDRGFRKDIIEWRDKWIATPRTADYAMQVMKRLLSFGVSRGDIDFNRALGIKALAKSDVRSEKIWTEDDIKSACEHEKTLPAVANVIRLAALTGLRRGDLVQLRWDQVGVKEITRPTNKSRGRRTAHIPILSETRILLDRMRAERSTEALQATTPVLVTPTGAQWSEAYLTRNITAVTRRLGKDLHLHDLRGTFVTRLCIAGMSDDEIADIVGWSLRAVARMRRTYVSKDAVADARIIKLERTGRRLKRPAKSLK
jgi:integrase